MESKYISIPGADNRDGIPRMPVSLIISFIVFPSFSCHASPMDSNLSFIHGVSFLNNIGKVHVEVPEPQVASAGEPSVKKCLEITACTCIQIQPCLFGG